MRWRSDPDVGADEGDQRLDRVAKRFISRR